MVDKLEEPRLHIGIFCQTQKWDQLDNVETLISELVGLNLEQNVEQDVHDTEG